MSKFVDISCAARMSKTQSHGTISLIPRYIDISRGVDVSRDTIPLIPRYTAISRGVGVSRNSAALMSRFVDIATLSLSFLDLWISRHCLFNV